MTLDDYGWKEYEEKHTDSETLDLLHVARVLSENKTNYNLITAQGERLGVLRGKALFKHAITVKPKAGDWVMFSNDDKDSLAVIESMLPRHTKLSRYDANEVGEEQILVANVDTVFIVMGLDGDFNLNRLERYLIMAENGTVAPVILLNKSDLVDGIQEKIDVVKTVSGDTQVLAVSGENKNGIKELEKLLKPRSTSVFVGSSGVGKSTLLNILLGNEIQATQGLRDDDRGRHTTTRRELFIIPNGAIIIDTPGMRELSVRGMDVEAIEDTFHDIDELTLQCKFRKCDHEKTEGCALLKAIELGELDANRLENYIKLSRESKLPESVFRTMDMEKRESRAIKKKLKHKK